MHRTMLATIISVLALLIALINGVPLTEVNTPETKEPSYDVIDADWSTLKDGDKCATLLRQSAKPYPFWLVGHAIHSLTVRDLKRFFDSSATETNFVPTVNRDLSSENALLSHAPDLKSPDDAMFATASMKAIDLSLSHMDDPNWEMRHHSILEKIVHSFHMEEVWTKAKIQYEVIKQAPPPEDVCDCVLDVERNGILKFLRFSALAIREPSLIYGGGLNKGKDEKDKTACCSYEFVGYAEYDFFKQQVAKKGSSAGRNVILRDAADSGVPLRDASSWKSWKSRMSGSEVGDYNTALFVHCALRKASSQT